MSKSNFTKTDLKTLAKFLAEEQKKIEDDKSILLEKKNKEKNLIIFERIMSNEISKDNYIDELLEEYLDEDEEFNDDIFLSDSHKILLEKIPEITNIINDLKLEYSKKTNDLLLKYKYIINKKLVDIGY